MDFSMQLLPSKIEFLGHQIRQSFVSPVNGQSFVSPVNVHIEPDNYEVHFKTNLIYQMSVAKEPNNPLQLSNYAQFLHLVVKDHDSADEWFKRAIQVEPQDAEALGAICLLLVAG
ncbi:hypothetical protein DITRI_Ditri04bG0046300 [Diplodiscus trichospermus]